tara:strand:+ start:691 stop:942 length:252 start_codon:yes stop_codon:yes gene_type:complete
VSEWKVLNTDELVPESSSGVFEEIYGAMQEKSEALVGSLASSGEEDSKVASITFTDPDSNASYGVAIVLYPDSRHEIGVCKRS